MKEQQLQEDICEVDVSSSTQLPSNNLLQVCPDRRKNQGSPLQKIRESITIKNRRGVFNGQVNIFALQVQPPLKFIMECLLIRRRHLKGFRCKETSCSIKSRFSLSRRTEEFRNITHSEKKDLKGSGVRGRDFLGGEIFYRTNCITGILEKLLGTRYPPQHHLF